MTCQAIGIQQAANTRPLLRIHDIVKKTKHWTHRNLDRHQIDLACNCIQRASSSLQGQNEEPPLHMFPDTCGTRARQPRNQPNNSTNQEGWLNVLHYVYSNLHDLGLRRMPGPGQDQASGMAMEIPVFTRPCAENGESQQVC